MISDRRHLIRERQRPVKPAAPIKCIAFDFIHTVRDYQIAAQAAAIIKSTISNTFHTVRNRDALQRTTVFERIITNLC